MIVNAETTMAQNDSWPNDSSYTRDIYTAMENHIFYREILGNDQELVDFVQPTMLDTPDISGIPLICQGYP